MNPVDRRRAVQMRALSTVVALLAAAVFVGAPPARASTGTTTSVRGGALGYWGHNISLFGGAQPESGPTPTANLAANASNSPQTATAPSGRVQYGPATLFTSDTITVSTTGSLGGSGSTSSASSIDNINQATTQPTYTGSEIFTADNLAGAVNASGGSAPSGSTSVTNGTVAAHSNASNNCTSVITPCGGHIHGPFNPDGLTPIPAQPPANYKVAGHVHLNDDTTDYYVIVFNEQIANADGSITVNPVHEYFGAKLDSTGNIVLDPPYTQGGSILHGDLFVGQVVAGVIDVPEPGLPAVVADFTGDGRTDRSVFRASQGVWFVKDGPTTAYGTEGDIATPADYDGDRRADTAVFRPSSGTWFIRNSTATEFALNYGIGSDIPTPADYDGDGSADVAVFRPSNGVWYIHRSSDGGDTYVAWGTSGDIPVVGDYDGDGHADVAVFRPSAGTWFVRNSGGTSSSTAYGTQGDVPSPADYDGDGRTDLAVFRPASGTWFVRNSGNATESVFNYGTQGDVPSVGDYDGDGRADISVFRPSNGVWFVHRSSDGAEAADAWGVSTDVPLPLPDAVQRFFRTGAP